MAIISLEVEMNELCCLE